MKTEQDIVYEKHCCKCSLRHTPNCYYDKCANNCGSYIYYTKKSKE